MAAGGLPLAFIGGRKGDFFFFLGHIWWLDENLFISLMGRRDACSLALAARRRPIAAGGLPLAFIGDRKGDFFFFLGHIWWLDDDLFVSLMGRRDACSRLSRPGVGLLC